VRSGADVPVALKAEDYLQRWRFASGLYDLIKTSLPEWSLRIGVYASWGEGKTTVLRFIETVARDDASPVARFNPWAIQDREVMWDAFAYGPGRYRACVRSGPMPSDNDTGLRPPI
jgi:predicted KAP-like P-loop ATPase